MEWLLDCVDEPAVEEVPLLRHIVVEVMTSVSVVVVVAVFD